MQSFDLYPQAWAVYLLLGIALLWLIDFKVKRWGFRIRAALLSLIAVGAFTPQQVTESDSYAPLILTSLFNAEVEGVSAIYQGLTTLVIIWGIVLSITFAIHHFFGAKNNSKESDTLKTESKV